MAFEEVTNMQVTVVFGGTGSVGAGVCRSLAKAGHTVVAHYHSGAAKARELVEEISGAGGTALAVQADLRLWYPRLQTALAQSTPQ